MARPAIQTFGKYQILERIATGGMAEIYKAKLEGIGGFQRTFAIKRILPHLSMNVDYVNMLVDEAKVAGLLSHANIVQILDLGQVEGVWYIAMEYVDGRDLGSVLKRASERGLRLPVPHACFIIVELLKGLEYAHQRQVMRGGRPVALNIIHRDVSPPNVLISFQGEVKLTDFGIARAALKAQETQAGVIKGRFDYMSPEQAAGSKDIDQRSDLFAVGVVLYEMICGRHPFRAESEYATLEAVRTGDYPSIARLNPDVPLPLQTIIDRALRVNPDERFPRATSFKEALDRFTHESGFVFSHPTLANYLRGLFPEDARGSNAPSTLTPRPGPPRVGFDVPSEDSITEGPTRVTDAHIDIARPMSASADGGRFGLQQAEDATAVRQNPLLAAASASAEADEQDTVIHASPMSLIDVPVHAPRSQDNRATLALNPRDVQRQRVQPLSVPPLSAPKPGLPWGMLAAAVGASILAGSCAGGLVGGLGVWYWVSFSG